MLTEQHSFGGHALDRYTHDYEALADAEIAPADGGVDAGAVPAPDPTASADDGTGGAPSPEPAAPAWTPDNPEALAAAQTQAAVDARIAELFGQDGQEPQFEFDPFADNPGQQIESMLSQLLDQKLAALQPIVAQHQTQTAETNRNAIFDKFTDLGDFDRKGAELTANGFFYEAQATAQPWQNPAEIALRKGAEYIANLTREAEKRGAENYGKHVETIDGAQTVPGADTSGGEAPRVYKNAKEAAEGWAERQNLRR